MRYQRTTLLRKGFLRISLATATLRVYFVNSLFTCALSAHDLAAQGISAYQSGDCYAASLLRKLVIYVCAISARPCCARDCKGARARSKTAVLAPFLNGAERRNPEKPGLPLVADAPNAKIKNDS